MSNRLTSFWSGKAVLITGASSGLGWAITEALAPYGIDFCLLSRREQRLNELAESLKDSGSRFWVRACDVRDRAQVYAAVREFHREHKRIDVVWVNSGVSRDSSFAKWNWEEVQTLIDTNLWGAIHTTQACLEVMVPQGSGVIAGVGSAASMRGLPSRGIYSLTKMGLDFYLESLAAELPQIQFTTIHPGFVDTPINQNNPNRFWLMTPEKAARIMITAVARGRRRLIYPVKMSLLFRLVRALPLFMYEPIARQTMSLSRPSE